MRKILLLFLGLALILLPLSAGAFTPMNYPDLESAFKIPGSSSIYSPSGLNNPDSLKVPAWKSWQSPSTNNYADSLKTPATWNSPTTTNYTSFLKVPAWKSWNSPSTTNYTATFTVPDVPVVLMSGELEGRILRLKAENPNIREILIKGKESEPDRRMDSRFVEDLLSTVPSLCAGHLPVHSVVSPGPIVLRERRRKTISWLHISDLHFHPPEYEADTILQDMVADIKTQVTRNDLRIDFIVVTGDITFSGQWKQYCRAINFFDAVLDATGAQKERLLIVPGNHDVHWASIEETLAAGYLARLTRTTDVDTVLGLPHERRDILRKLPHYRRFIDKYMVNTSGEKLRPCDYRRFFFVETMVIADKRVSVLGLNSAWMSAYKWKPSKEKQIADDRHNLILGNWQLREALKEAKQNNSDIVIAAMHHPTEWLKDDIDRPIIEDLLERNCPFVLQGHLHETQVIGKAGPTGKMLTITAGASFQRRQDAIGYNGYNIVQLDLDGGVGTVFIRCYSPKRAGFWTADTFSYPNTPEGRYTFTLPDSLL